MRFFGFFLIIIVGMWIGSPVGGAAERITIDRAAVIVNNKMMTEQELRALQGLQEKEIRTRFKGEEQAKRLKELREQLIERVVENLLLESRADALAIEVPDAEIDERVQTLLKNNPRIADVYTDETLRALIVKDILSKRVLQQEVASRIAVGEEDVLAACRDSKGDARQIEVGHILLRAKTPQSVTKLLEIRDQLKKGAEFEEIARKYSEDPSAQANSGRLGFVSRGQFVKAFEEKAFSLKVGELSDPVNTQFGYHLIRRYL